jgi:AraC-like DNA-binding protein
MKIVETTNQLNQPYAPHLVVREFSLAPGKEWAPQTAGWTLILVGSGTGYWLQGQARVELESGMALLVAGDKAGRVLASCLNGMLLHFFTVMPDRLPGLITQGEQDLLKQAERKEAGLRLVPANHPAAVRLGELCKLPQQVGLRFRLNLLQLMVEIFGGDLNLPAGDQLQTDVKERLRSFLQETPPAGLLEISFEDLARITHCTPRHLSRVFYDVIGMSFREKRAEIRLALARDLLATSQAKVVDVAFKSGYKSLSLFNRMFTRRFGISPGRWRQKNGGIKGVVEQRKPRARVAVNESRFRGLQ